MTSSEQPFAVSVPDSALELLQKKLALTTFPDEIPDSGWKYGAPLQDIQRLVNRWQDGFDWRKQEAKINAEMPQFTRDIDVDGHGTLNIHYVHKKSSVANAIPLLFVHGWPGTFMEVRKLLPLLTNADGEGPSFHVISPSLPGYGFSEAPKTQGFSVQQYAEVCHKLMLELGYDEYVTQGGDWGHLITRMISVAYGHKHSKAWHTNVVFGRPPPDQTTEPELYQSNLANPYTEFEKKALAGAEWYKTQGDGYFKEQGTNPQTIGYSLTDSPVGLLAWIYEKFHYWTDNYQWEDDEVLEWISIYWFSRAGPTASTRIYYEVYQGMIQTGGTIPKSTIPMGVSYFPVELGYARPSWIRATVGNLVTHEYHDKGGHFAAHERPEELAGDVKKMFAKGGPAYGVVTGKDGY